MSGDLEPGESYTVEQTFDLSPALKGSYAMVLTDAHRLVIESDENNNFLSADTDVVSNPGDLVVTSVVTQPDNSSGEQTTIEWTVQNVGPTILWPGTQYWVDYVWLSPDPTFIASRATVMGRFSHEHDQPMAPGESYTQSQQVTLPRGIGGDFFIYVRANVMNLGDKGNKPVTWPPQAGKNRSVLGAYPSREFFEAHAFEDPNNNLFRQPIPVTYREPDLQIVDLVVPTGVDSGETFPVTFTVQNVGTRDTRQAIWKDRVYLSTDPSLDNGDLFLAETQRGELLPTGNAYTETVDVKVPDGIEGGFYILAFTDSNVRSNVFAPSTILPTLRGLSLGADATLARVEEFRDEGNNVTVAALPITLTAPPDLQVASVDVPVRVTTGEVFDLIYRVENRGTGPTPEAQSTWDDLIYWSRDQFLDLQADRFIASRRHTGGLGAGDGYDVTASVQVPSDLQGPFYILVVTDPRRFNPRGTVFEDDLELNNATPSPDPLIIELPPPTDLQVTDVDIPPSAMAGELVHIQWTVTVPSSLTVPADGSWSDSVYLSSDAIWDISDVPMGRAPFRGTVNPGESYTSSIDVPLPSVKPGQYRVIARTDIFNQVYEAELEANNRTASPNVLSTQLDALFIGVPLETTLSPGQERLYEITVSRDQTLQVTITSPAELAANELFLRFDDVPSSREFDAIYQGALAANQTAVIPSTQPGKYFVLVRGQSQPEDDTPVTILARFLPLGITNVRADIGGDSRWVTMTVEGAQFHENAILKIVRPAIAEYEPVRYEVIDRTKIIGIFDFQDAPHGLYDVKVINPSGEEAVVPYRYQIERAIEPEVTIGIGGPRTIMAGEVGTYSIALQSLTNIDTPYVDFRVGIPEMGFNGAIYGLPYVTFTSNLRGQPEQGDLDDVPWASLDSAVNLDGEILAQGSTFDFAAGGFTGFTFNLHTYPGLNELSDRAFEDFREVLYAQFLDLAKEGVLDDGPQGLDEFFERIKEKIVQQAPELAGVLDGLPSLTEVYNDNVAVPSECQTVYIPHRFHVVAAATALTRDEFIALQTDEALRLRDAILADDTASSALVVLAADSDMWTQLYLASLEEAGILRPEGEVPPIRENPNLVSLMAVLSSGVLAGPAGEQIRTDGNLIEFFDQVHRWYGDTPGQLAPHDLDQRGAKDCDPPFYDIVEPHRPNFADFDLGASSPTHFEAFDIFAAWVPYEERGAGLPVEFQIEGPKPVDSSGRQPLDFSALFEQEGTVGRHASMTGPLTFDTSGFLPFGQRLPYTVNFVNDPNASRSVGEVRVVTQLDENLDPRSFRLGDLQLGDIQVHIPSSRAVFQGDFDFAEAKGFVLRVSAGIDIGTRTATWVLQAIDPNTGEVVQDADLGLLPANNAQGDGAGFVTYTVTTADAIETGQQITAEARVLYNTAAPEDTTTLTHTVDGVAPTTSLAATPLGDDNTDFQVQWDAIDDPSGSGVKHVTVYVATGGGDFEIWLRQTTETTAIFEGQADTTYEFLALATDVAGNREPPPIGVSATDDGSQVNLGALPTVPEGHDHNSGRCWQ